MRKLVTIRTVNDIHPIPGADLIEAAVIDGWECVVKKGEFKVGDSGVYFEIDSFLPAADKRYEFLAKNFTTWNNKQGARIRTIKLKGQISQGLLLPLASFPEINQTSFFSSSEKDFSDLLKVEKWERETLEGTNGRQAKKTRLGQYLAKLRYGPLRRFVKWLESKYPTWFSNAPRGFPDFIPKTDEERLQNLIRKEWFRSNPEDRYEVSIKLDGSSMTVYHYKGKTGVCSRNIDLVKDEGDKFWNAALAADLPSALRSLGRNLALQGELMGPSIQGNREQLKHDDYFLYKVYDIDEKRFLTPGERLELFARIEELTKSAFVPMKHVPIIEVGSKIDHFVGIEDFLAYAEGPSLNAKTREGLVFKKLDGKFSFKVISNSYLLKHGE